MTFSIREELVKLFGAGMVAARERAIREAVWGEIPDGAFSVVAFDGIAALNERTEFTGTSFVYRCDGVFALNREVLLP